MRHFNITGMTCAACSARVEKAVKKLDSVDSCSVNLLTNSMSVDGSVSTDDIIKAVTAVGYGIELKGSKTKNNTNAEVPDNKSTVKLLKNRLIASLIFLVVLMYISMGHLMWGLVLPSFVSQNHLAIALLQLILTAIVLVINQRFFISGFKGLINKAPNMDTLVSLGSGASFIYSMVVVFAMTDAQINGNIDLAVHYLHELYFESSAMILTLITVGKMLEAYSKGKTTDAIKGLMNLAPKTATLLKNDNEVSVPIDEVQKDDIFIVRTGERVPVDGIVIEGSGSVDESAITGESIPVFKEQGAKVIGATINQSGYIKCRATDVGEDTTLSQIIKMVTDASATKAPVAKLADKVSGVFVPIVIAIAVVTIAVWLLSGQTIGYSLARGISVLVISCPCALGLATPVAIMVGNGVGAKKGVLFKTARSLEETGRVSIVALDKTGTITEGKPVITDIFTCKDISETNLLQKAYSLEKYSEHPLAKAIVEECKAKGIESEKIIDFDVIAGKGLSGNIGKNKIYGGNLKYIKQYCDIPVYINDEAIKLSEQGKTPLYFAENNSLIGVIAVADTIKDSSAAAIKELQNMGITVVMITGDNERTAKAVGDIAGVDKVYAGVLPDEKEKIIKALKDYGKVAMVGDGINDAPALTSADTGIAIGTGTDIAIDAADVVLMKSKLSDVPAAIRLSRATLKIIRENLFWAFIYNIIGIPLAAGVWIPLLGWQLNPMFGAAAMSLSSFCVVSNALRLNFVNIYSTKHDKKIKRSTTVNYITKENKTMEKTIKIEGMMCPHCEAAVKSCLEALEEVNSAEVSHKTNTAVLTLNAEISDETLKKVIEDKGYKVIE